MDVNRICNKMAELPNSYKPTADHLTDFDLCQTLDSNSVKYAMVNQMIMLLFFLKALGILPSLSGAFFYVLTIPVPQKAQDIFLSLAFRVQDADFFQGFYDFVIFGKDVYKRAVGISRTKIF